MTTIAAGFSSGRGGRGGPAPSRRDYGVTFEMRVPQFASAVRVLPHVRPVATYSWNVQVCPMYSEASQTEFPSAAAAP